MTIGELITKHQLTAGIYCGEGWADLLDRLLTTVEPLGFKPEHLDGIKEKYGGARISIFVEQDQRTKAARHATAIEERIYQAERESYTICEFCGQPGHPREDFGWVLTLCDGCRAKTLERSMVLPCVSTSPAR